MSVDLRRTTNRGYEPGRPFWVRALWLVTEAALFTNPIVISYGWKRTLLRAFGATVGHGAIIKPGVKVKYPWRLTVGANAWLGERAWLDNMEDIVIGANAVVSQGAYICTGNHDWSDPGMGLTPKPTVIEDGGWVAAFARIGPGVRVAEESIVALGAVVTSDTEPRGIYVGNPAQRVGYRQIVDGHGADAGLSAAAREASAESFSSARPV